MNKIIMLFSTIIAFSALQAEITEIHEIESVKNYVTDDSVVFLNVGDTLFAPSSMLGDYQFREYFVERVNTLVTDKNSADAIINEVKRIIVEKIPKVTPEKVTPLVIQGLQDSKVPVLGYSRRFFSTAYAPNNGEIVHNHLEGMGIDLPGTLSYYRAPEYNDEYNFQYGILFTNKKAVGPAVVNFFAKMNDKPVRVIVVDDSVEDLMNVQNSLKESSIETVLLRYNSVDARKKTFNPELASVEFFEYFLDCRLMTDEEALQMKQTDEGQITDYEEMLDAWILEKVISLQ
jgi:hypothetical protein